MKIRRDELLSTLEQVQFGVAQRENVSFSRAFCFQNGKVTAFNDEILCSAALPGAKTNKVLKQLTGAVDAQRLLGMLRKLPDAELDLQQKNGEIILSGDRKRDYFRVEKLEGQDLPAEQVEAPGEWKRLPDGFSEAIALAQDCTKEKDSIFSRTCVHLTPDMIEAYDNFQIIRCFIKTGLSSDYLLRKEAVKSLASLGMVKFSETDNWLHFKNGSGLLYSCRRWMEEYPNLDSFFDCSNTTSIVIPKGLEDIIDRAQEFTQEMADANRVKVQIRDSKIYVTGLGVTGRHEEDRDIDYKGDDYAFLIAPNLLTSLVKKYKEAELARHPETNKPSTLVVKGSTKDKDGNITLEWTYLAWLINPDDVEQIDGEEEEEAHAEEAEGDEE